MQRFVDQAGYFNMLSRSDSRAAIRDGDAVVGVTIDEMLHRFDVKTVRPGEGGPLRASNITGEPIARSRQQWFFAPDGFVGAPGRMPQPTPFDPSRPQRFTMAAAEFTFAGGADGFRGFGTGTTLPAAGNGSHSSVLATAIGTIFDGFGRFANHDEGTYVYCGTLSPEHGFTGNLMLRVIDRERTLQASRPLPGIRREADLEPGVNYLVLRGEASPDDPVSPHIGPDGRPLGLIVEQGLRLQHIDCAADAASGVRALDRVGERVGRVTAYVTFDPSAADGSPRNPIPFTAYDEFVFFDRAGRKAGGFVADSFEGRVFNAAIAGRPAIRFGGVGRIRGGTGTFQGIRGLMTDNSLVMFAPHASASVYVLRIDGFV